MFNYLLIFIFLFFAPPVFSDQLIIEPDAGRLPLIQAIQAAQSIDLSIYGFTDKTLLNALINAKKAGKNIRVLLESTPYKQENENKNSIKKLTAASIPIHFPDSRFALLHQKTFLFDQNKVIVMTFNLTRATFTSERNFALVITDPFEIKEIQSVFLHDWKHQLSYPHHTDLIWSPDNSRQKILALIKSAEKNINIYSENLTDYQIIGALAKAARSGIQVRILQSDNQLSDKKWDYLKRAGVMVHTSTNLRIHAKVIIIDNRLAMLGSINFTKPSLEKNRELSMITRDSSVIHALLNTFAVDWQQIN